MKLFTYVCPNRCPFTPGQLERPAKVRKCHRCGAERVELIHEIELRVLATSRPGRGTRIQANVCVASPRGARRVGRRDDGDGRVPYVDKQGRLTIYKWPGDSWQVANKRDAEFLAATESRAVPGRAGRNKDILVRRYMPVPTRGDDR